MFGLIYTLKIINFIIKFQNEINILTQTVFTKLIYEQGADSSFNLIQGPFSITKTITFTNNFQQVPQIIIQPFKLAISSNQNEIQFQVISVSLTNFHRIQVLNPPLETIVTNGTIYTYIRTKSQATQAFVILKSFGYSIKGFDFQVSVYSVSDTNVKIQLLTSNSKIQSIGFLILIGTKEAFFTTNEQKTGSGTDIIGQYSVKKLQNSLLYLPIIGFRWSGIDTIESHCNQQLYHRIINTLIVHFLVPQCNQYHFKVVNFLHQYFFPIMQKNIKFLNNLQNSQPIKFQLILLKLIKVLTLIHYKQLICEIEYVLTTGKKVQGYILKCNECGEIINILLINNTHQVKDIFQISNLIVTIYQFRFDYNIFYDIKQDINLISYQLSCRNNRYFIV